MKLNENQLKAIEALRTTKKPQGVRAFIQRDEKTGQYCYCALGVIAEEVLGIDLMDNELVETAHETVWKDLKDAGFSTIAIFSKNDGRGTSKHSFAEIADVMEQDPEAVFREVA